MAFEKYHSPLSPEALRAACARIKHVALDMDGTIYLGSTLFEWTPRFLKMLRDAGIGYSFLTNNPTRSIAAYVEKLNGLGIEATPEEVYTTSVAAREYIRSHFPEAKRLFILGTPSMIAEFEADGYEICADDAADRPDVLVVAFDTTLTYSRLCRAAWWAAQGLPYVATNPDRVCPTDKEEVLVDCGSLTTCIEYATGRHPDVVIGKPNPDMLRCITERYGLQPDEVAMCGDRIYTDVATARNAGSLGVLVLSGETTLATAMASDPQPDITVDNVETFGKMLIEGRN